jgi:hypothetical protein
MQFYEVKFRPVALVLAEAILREPSAEVAHNRVARDLRDHARGGDGEAVAIAVDDRRLRQGKWKYGQPVDEDVLRFKGQSGDRDSHRFVGRAQNIDHVDLDRVNDADRPGDRIVRHQIVVNLFAFLRQKLLRVVQLSVPEFFREDDGRGYDWTRQRATPRFVDARDRGEAESAKLSFVSESAPPIHRQENTVTARN